MQCEWTRLYVLGGPRCLAPATVRAWEHRPEYDRDFVVYEACDEHASECDERARRGQYIWHEQIGENAC